VTKEEELREYRAMLSLSGVSRKEAAGWLSLAVSTLNRKLRGEIALTQQEKAILMNRTEIRRGLLNEQQTA